MSAPIGVLLSNIGTPDSYRVKDVAKYLRQFLMDEEIIPLPYLLRYLLVHAVIVPRRAPFSAKNYEAIWTSEGSPLRVLSDRLKDNLQTSLGQDYKVEVGMLFGNPSISQALKNFQSAGVTEIILAPLYPQFASVTTVATRKKTREVLRQEGLSFKMRELLPFYNDPGFIRASAEVTRQKLESKQVDHYLMTFHGLPESQLKKTEGCLQSANCCQRPQACALGCYRAQCFKTAELLAKELNLSRDQWSVSFQSRLGRAEWAKPYTEETLKALAGNGVKSLAVLCPSFVSDCLETLEELGVQGAETFHHAGGKDFHLVPCVNERADYLARLLTSENSVTS